jgi:D-alanine-D-alanine ligase
MHIGLTFDAVADWQAEGLDAEHLAEFDGEETIGAIEQFWRRRGHAVERIGRLQSLVRRLADGGSWDLVFNICEGLRGMARESTVPALLDAYGVPYPFSDPAVLAVALHKGLAKRVVRDAGVPTAPFAILDDARDACHVDVPWPVFVKPVAEGTGKGIGAHSLCRTEAELEAIARLLIRRFRQPALVETWLPGREFTVGVLGCGGDAEIIGVMEIESVETYGFATKKHYQQVRYRLAGDAEAEAAGFVALAAWRALGGRDGGRIDIRSDAVGQPAFLEANPLPGLHPLDSDLVVLAELAGRSYDWLMERICERACRRLGLDWREAA